MTTCPSFPTRALRLLALAAALTALAPACRKAAPSEPGIAMRVGRASPEAFAVASRASVAFAGGAGGGMPQLAGPSLPRPGVTRAANDPATLLAYAYSMSLELPADRLIAVVDAHVAACRTAGPQVCQLIESRREGVPERRLDAAVTLRAEPAWLQRFMQGVTRDAAGADGSVTSQSMSAEDLTREIVDTEATLRARRALRDRLQQLLATRPGSLSDLLGVERELARVQGEIDATESTLTLMRTRVSMARLTLTYASAAGGAGGSTFAPLRDAVAGFVLAVVESTAALVTVVGSLLPWIAAGTIVIWLLLIWRRRRARRQAVVR